MGARKDGWAGFAKGMGKGTSGFLTHNGSGIMGLFAYPVQGLYKSIVSAVHTGTQGEILKATVDVGRMMAARAGHNDADERRVLELFNNACSSRKAYEKLRSEP